MKDESLVSQELYSLSLPSDVPWLATDSFEVDVVSREWGRHECQSFLSSKDGTWRFQARKLLLRCPSTSPLGGWGGGRRGSGCGWFLRYLHCSVIFSPNYTCIWAMSSLGEMAWNKRWSRRKCSNEIKQENDSVGIHWKNKRKMKRTEHHPMKAVLMWGGVHFGGRSEFAKFRTVLQQTPFPGGRRIWLLSWSFLIFFLILFHSEM